MHCVPTLDWFAVNCCYISSRRYHFAILYVCDFLRERVGFPCFVHGHVPNWVNLQQI